MRTIRFLGLLCFFFLTAKSQIIEDLPVAAALVDGDDTTIGMFLVCTGDYF